MNSDPQFLLNQIKQKQKALSARLQRLSWGLVITELAAISDSKQTAHVLINLQLISKVFQAWSGFHILQYFPTS